MHSISNSIVSVLSVATSRGFKAGAAFAMGLLMISPALLAHDAIDGQSSNVNIQVNTPDWIPLGTVTIVIADDAEHECVVTGAADVQSSGNSLADRYRFTLAHNELDPPIDEGQERTVELNSNANVNDPNIKAVATTKVFTNLTNNGGIGVHHFRLLVRKASTMAANTTVLDSSLSMVCVPNGAAGGGGADND